MEIDVLKCSEVSKLSVESYKKGFRLDQNVQVLVFVLRNFNLYFICFCEICRFQMVGALFEKIHDFGIVKSKLQISHSVLFNVRVWMLILVFFL